MITSASQLKTLQLCLRKWWFEKIAKLPTPRPRNLAFGTLLHSCIERFLLGEKDLFPPGWDKDEESGETLTPAEAQLIQVLVRKGIDNGIIERRPGSQVEQKFEFEVIPGVTAIGYIDHEDETLVEDHKSSKSTRYLLSSKALLRDIQMMLYGKKKLLEHRLKGIAPPPIITLAHNQFVKDPDTPVVKKTKAETTPHKIEEFFQETIVPLAHAMVMVSKVENPFDLPEPEASSCNAYGGCPFMTICSQGETMESFRKRMERMSNPETKTMTQVDPTAFLANRRSAKSQATPPAPATPVNPPAKPAAPAPAAAVPNPNRPTNTPPWYSTNCLVCNARGMMHGFNPSKKQPCRLCAAGTGWSIAKIEAEFDYKFSDNGTLIWAAKASGLPVAEPIPAPQPVVAEARAEVVEEVEEVVEEEAPPEPEPAPAPAPVEQPRRRGPGRPKKSDTEPASAQSPQGITSSPEKSAEPGVGLILVINAAINKPFPGKVMLTMEQWLTTSHPEYFEQKDVFARRHELRSAILANAETWHERLRNTVIVQAISDPDLDAAAVSLAMLPSTVVIYGPR